MRAQSKEKTIRASAICFTAHGEQMLAGILCKNTDGQSDIVWKAVSAGSWKPQTDIPRLDGQTSEWVGKAFTESDLVLFVGAAGIAVRLIAPFVRSKKTDPAVLVMDEAGKYVIPLLSGHLGGANAFAGMLAEMTGAAPVITTATDLENLFAVDVFARKNDLQIDSMQLAKQVSAELLQGKRIDMTSDFPAEGMIPKEIRFIFKDTGNEWGQRQRTGTGILISRCLEDSPFPQTLHLYPQDVVIGIGCKRGKKKEEILSLVEKTLHQADISKECVRAFASIDIKKDEAGIREAAEAWSVPFVTFPAEELEQVRGDFSESDFVRRITGTGSVCERSAVRGCAAVCSCENADCELLLKKTAEDGVTAAIAARRRRVCF